MVKCFAESPPKELDFQQKWRTLRCITDSVDCHMDRNQGQRPRLRIQSSWIRLNYALPLPKFFLKKARNLKVILKSLSAITERAEYCIRSEVPSKKVLLHLQLVTGSSYVLLFLLVGVKIIVRWTVCGKVHTAASHWNMVSQYIPP